MTPCKRCGLLYEKQLDQCPNCSGIDDAKLKVLLKQRSQMRLSIGKAMYIGAIIIVVIMVIALIKKSVGG